MKLLEWILYTAQVLSQSPRKVEVGRDLWMSSCQGHLLQRETARATASGSCPYCSSVSLLLSLGTTGESLAASSLQPPFRPFLCVDEMPSEPPLPQSQLAQPLLRGEILQCANGLHGRLLSSLQYVHASLLLGNPEADAVLQLWHHQCQVEGKAHLPHLTPPDAVLDTVSVPCGKGTLLAPSQRGAHQDLQGFFCQAPFQPGSPPHVLEPGVVPPQVQDFALPLAELAGAPASAGYEPGVMPRAAPSRDSVQEEGFGRRRREAAAGSAGW